MEIRTGKLEDSAAIKAIDSSVVSDPTRAEFIDVSLQEGVVQVALLDGVIVGYIVINRSFFRRPTLEMLMVAEDHRGSGIGKSLIRKAQDKVGPGNEIWTSTNESNSRMQSLLASEGFQRTGRIENLDPGDPELVYFKQLVET